MAVDFPIPKACSLVQAALWVTRTQPPISEFAFEAAPLLLEPSEIDPQGPLRQLLLTLRNGDLPAGGRFDLFARETFREDEKWTPRSGAYLVRIPEEFWRWPNVQWQNSQITGIELFHPGFRYFTSEYEPEKFQELREASRSIEQSGMQQKLIVSLIAVGTRKLLKLFPGTCDPEQVPCISEPAPSPLQPPTYIPPYVEFMLRASRELDLQRRRREPKDRLEQWIKKHWPDSLGKFSNTKCQYMATFLRDPSDEKGGHFREDRSR